MRPEESSPAMDIYRQFRGLITSGQMGAEERLPTVRQTAADLGVAPGTVAKAYKLLERDGLVLTRVGSGTRVSPAAAALPSAVVRSVRQLVRQTSAAELDPDDVVEAFRAIWSAEAG